MDILHLPPLRVDVERPLQFPWGKPFKFNIVLCVWTTQNQNESRFSSDESDDRFACCIILGSTVSDGQSRHEHSKLCRAGQLAKLATANDGLCSLRLRRLRGRAQCLCGTRWLWRIPTGFCTLLWVGHETGWQNLCGFRVPGSNVYVNTEECW